MWLARHVPLHHLITKAYGYYNPNLSMRTLTLWKFKKLLQFVISVQIQGSLNSVSTRWTTVGFFFKFPCLFVCFLQTCSAISCAPHFIEKDLFIFDLQRQNNRSKLWQTLSLLGVTLVSVLPEESLSQIL